MRNNQLLSKSADLYGHATENKVGDYIYGEFDLTLEVVDITSNSTQ